MEYGPARSIFLGEKTVSGLITTHAEEIPTRVRLPS